jgi:nitrite reductase/ring-hydroxylating ferredoxin subunit
VLSWLLGSWAAGVVGAVIYPIARFIVPPDIPESPTLSVSAGPASAMPPNSGRLIPFGQQPALLIRLPNGELRAFNAECTHLSCTVEYREDAQDIFCACHNGRYDLNGRNVAGPPPRPLQAYEVSVQDDEITVTRRS